MAFSAPMHAMLQSFYAMEQPGYHGCVEICGTTFWKRWSKEQHSFRSEVGAT